ADYEAALDNALNAAFMDSGLLCSAGTRLILQDSIAEQFVDDLVARAEGIVMGGPLDPQAETGPLISEEHRDKVTDYVERRSEEHTSELQSRFDLVCRLLLEKKTN